jgi:hypothetical protein
MQLDETDIFPEMDPRLQYAADRRNRGFTTVATASSDADESGVIALVNSVEAFAGRTDVRVGAEIGPTDGGTIVTARVPLSRVERVRRADGPRRAVGQPQVRNQSLHTSREVYDCRAGPRTTVMETESVKQDHVRRHSVHPAPPWASEYPTAPQLSGAGGPPPWA